MTAYRPSSCLLFAFGMFFCLIASAHADGMNLYLKDGSVVRGEITERSAEVVTVATAKGTIRIETTKLMPISRRQLKLPEDSASASVEAKTDSDMEVLIHQVETLLAENETLKKEIAVLKQENGKMNVGEASSPGEGPKENKP